MRTERCFCVAIVVTSAYTAVLRSTQLCSGALVLAKQRSSWLPKYVVDTVKYGMSGTGDPERHSTACTSVLRMIGSAWGEASNASRPVIRSGTYKTVLQRNVRDKQSVHATEHSAMGFSALPCTPDRQRCLARLAASFRTAANGPTRPH